MVDSRSVKAALVLVLWLLVVAVPVAWAQGEGPLAAASESDFDFVLPLEATTVARGVPGAGAVCQVGLMHRGNPLHDNPALSPLTQPGLVMDMSRLFVASTSNFGAPLGSPGDYPGSVLSLDVSGGPLAVPPDFATGGGQASTLGGAVRLFTANSPAFLNSVKNPTAVTAPLPAAAFPLGISINNGGGRPWIANAPRGSSGQGSISVLDPGGYGLAGAPDPVAGGEFSGTQTNRTPGLGHGLTSPAVATALVSRSVDGSHRAVFLTAMADGSVVQVHVQKGVDDLAPPGTFTPLTDVEPAAAESTDPEAITRVGMLFNWVPSRVAYVADPRGDRLVALDLADDGKLLVLAGTRSLHSRWLHRPVDLAPAVPEVAARNFASNTTLGGGSDLYVLNRGDNTIVRLTQGGRLRGVRRIVTREPDFRASGLTVSDDARTLWITGTTAGRGGVVLKLPAFGQGFVTPQLLAHAEQDSAAHAVAQGRDLFSFELGPAQGLGPLFNGRSCASCHNAPFAGGEGDGASTSVTRVAHLGHGTVDDLTGRGGPVARADSISALGVSCELRPGVPPLANATAVRAAQTLRGTSLIDNIVDADIVAHAATEPAAVRGRPNLAPDGRVGHFGWKAQVASLVEFMGEALRTELGVTNPLAPRDEVHGCGADLLKPEVDATVLTSLVAFLDTLDPPAPAAACLASPGAALFGTLGCASCHAPTLPGPGNLVQVPLYSDLLLHEMGPGLAEPFPQGAAGASEFRTAPLWRVADRRHFLHDGRAVSLPDAIAAHGGQAASARDLFEALSDADRQALLAFLGCI
jgi:Di-haem oxidoreductase, putative peroxidase